MQRTILVSESANFSSAAAIRLEQAGRVMWADLDRPGLLAAVSQADLLWVRLRNKIDREVIDAAPQLRAIATPTTGLTHVDVTYAAKRGIEVISLRGETQFLEKIYATGEHTLSLILVVRRLPASARHVVEGGWNRDLFRGRELHGKTAGVVVMAGWAHGRWLSASHGDASVSERSNHKQLTCRGGNTVVGRFVRAIRSGELACSFDPGNTWIFGPAGVCPHEGWRVVCQYFTRRAD